jgi:hypothetical protein
LFAAALAALVFGLSFVAVIPPGDAFGSHVRCASFSISRPLRGGWPPGPTKYSNTAGTFSVVLRFRGESVNFSAATRPVAHLLLFDPAGSPPKDYPYSPPTTNDGANYRSIPGAIAIPIQQVRFCFVPTPTPTPTPIVPTPTPTPTPDPAQAP